MPHDAKRLQREIAGEKAATFPIVSLLPGHFIDSAVAELTAAKRLLEADVPGLAVDALAVAEGRVADARRALCVSVKPINAENR